MIEYPWLYEEKGLVLVVQTCNPDISELRKQEHEFEVRLDKSEILSQKQENQPEYLDRQRLPLSLL